MGSRFEKLPTLIGLMAAYGLLAAAAIAMTRLSGGIALLWVATAPLLALLNDRPIREWPPLILAAMIGNIGAAVLVSPLAAVALPITIANMSEAVIAALLLRRWHVSDSPIGSSRSVALFVVAAGVVAPMLSGALGALIVGPRVAHSFGGIWLDWTIGHGLGSLIATPLALLALHRDHLRAKLDDRRRWVEGVGLTLLVALVTIGVFVQARLPLLFLVSLPVLIATMRFQRLGAIAGVAIVALISGGLTLAGYGPVMLVQSGEGLRFQFYQLFLAVQFLLALPVASVLSERAAALGALRESEARYRLLADNVTDALLTLDPDGTIRFATPATRALGCLDPDALTGRNALSFVYPEDRDRVQAAHRAALADPGRSFTVEYRIRDAEGIPGWFETNTRAVTDARGRVESVVSVVRSIGSRKAREAELERQAATDPLTGLLNRAAMRRRFEDAVDRLDAQPAVLALFDLDHFKRVNDTHGHVAGDSVLLGFADLLSENVRPGDAVARMGGEEFAVLFEGTSLPQAEAICDRLRALLAATPLTNGADGPLRVTTSIGLAPFGEDITRTVRSADTALYAAKAAGRNCVMLAEVE